MYQNWLGTGKKKSSPVLYMKQRNTKTTKIKTNYSEQRYTLLSLTYFIWLLKRYKLYFAVKTITKVIWQKINAYVEKYTP